MGQITRLLDSHRGGAPDAIDRLLGEIYPSIRRLAGKLLHGESGTPTLQPTVLAHEFALKLLGGSGERLVNRAHLMATAALEMRHTIARHAARRRRRFSDAEVEAQSGPAYGANRELVLTLERALCRLEQLDPELISIAGIYRTSDNPLPADVLGKTAQVRLMSGPEGDKLVIDPLNP